VTVRTNRKIARTAVALAAAGLLTVGLAAPPAAALQHAAAALPDANLILHYDFEASEVSGSTVTDKALTPLNGVIANSASASLVEGRLPGTSALALSGGAASSTTASYVTLPAGVVPSTTSALTVSTWIKWDGTSGNNWQWYYTLGRNTNSTLMASPSFGYSGNDASTIAVKPVRNASGANNAEVPARASGPASVGQWTNVVAVLSGQTISYYINGVKVASAAATASLGSILGGGTVSGYIGRAWWTGSNDHGYFDGAIDDFRVYDTALTDQQVLELAVDPGISVTDADDISLSTNVGTAPALPAVVTAKYSDGSTRGAEVRWDTVPASSYASRGTFDVRGVIGDAEGAVEIVAHVKVSAPNEFVVDLGAPTGEFHGGASGTLYGVYGEGLPSANLLEGINLRTVSTKAQDGPQHPGADALEVVKPLADATDGDVYIYMTDIHRGFPYQWPGATGPEKVELYLEKIENQVRQVRELPEEYQDNIVFVPYNEPEGNMFGTGQWSYNRVSWLNNPTAFFDAWDRTYRLIKSLMPDARIAGPNTSVLYNQVNGFLQHTVQADTVPEVMTWHELSDPATVRSSVARYRAWEQAAFAGTEHAGRQLPININEYAFNYHTSVPAQMIQWIAAVEDSKVDADIAYWNIDGNLSDSAVQSNRGNGQWWLLHEYSRMSGHTVSVTPPRPNVSYTLQGVATLDESKKQAQLILGGQGGSSTVYFDRVPQDVFGSSVHVSVREIPWTGQLGDSAQPLQVAEYDIPVTGGSLAVAFGSGQLPQLDASSAYQVILTPGAAETAPTAPSELWSATYEAENAAHTGTGWTRNGPEGSPSNVGGFYTSGNYSVGGIRTGSDVQLNFAVDVPQDGRYDLSVFANSLNTFAAVAESGPTNAFIRVDGGAEQEVLLPLGYKWVVWDHVDLGVDLTAGQHTITIAARSLDGTRSTKGDAIIDKIDLTLKNPDAAIAAYEAEYADMQGTAPLYTASGVSGAGAVPLEAEDVLTFWAYSAVDGGASVSVDASGSGSAEVQVNGVTIGTVAGATDLAAYLSGGVNKITVTGIEGSLLVDRLRIDDGDGSLEATRYQAEDAALAGDAKVVTLTNADGDRVVTSIGGEPGNTNTITFEDVEADEAGTYALTIRYSNEEQSPPSHYNPDPIARHADLSINGGESVRVWFPHTFHENNFWELTVPITLEKGENTLEFRSEELPNFDGETYISDQWDIPLRSQLAPNLDWISVAPFAERQAPALDVAVTNATRCVAGKVVLVTTVTNNAGLPVSVDVSTPYGSKSSKSLAEGKSMANVFTTRLQTMPDGAITVVSTAVVDGVPVESEQVIEFPAATC
jgi:hypothetical protein